MAKTTAPRQDLLTMQQAAELMSTTRATVYRWLREGRLTAVKVGRQWRFPREEVERFLHGEEPRVDLPADLTPFLNALAAQLEQPSPRTGDPLKDAFALMIEVALQQDASSMHLSTFYTEAGPDRVSWLRNRVDGLVQPTAQLDSRLVPPLIEHWKKAAACDPRDSSAPQDGRIIISSGADTEENRMIDLRVSFLPAMLGETMTVRVLDRRRSRLRLEQLQLTQRDREMLNETLAQRSRMVVISGPSGSARSTVLTACLREISGPQSKLVTVEGQAWQFLPWATQVPLSCMGSSRSYAVALRTILRSDPDIVGMERVNDPETLQAAQEAALNGALVVMAMDTDGAVATLKRLTDLSGTAVVLSQTLAAVLSQRLVRKLCNDCSTPHTVSDQEYERLSLSAKQGGLSPTGLRRDFRKATGCRACAGIGYRKRAMLTESLKLSSTIVKLLGEDAPDEQLTRAAIEDGMTTLDARAIEMAAAGLTSLDEVARYL